MRVTGVLLTKNARWSRYYLDGKNPHRDPKAQIAIKCDAFYGASEGFHTRQNGSGRSAVCGSSSINIESKSGRHRI